MDRVMFVVKGAVRIFGLLKDGTCTPVARGEAPFLPGDIEYVTGGRSVFFAGAGEETLCLCLLLARYRSVLDEDAGFLRTLLSSCARKLSMISGLDPVSMKLKDRLLLCLKDERSGHEICRLEPVLLKLRCSRRHVLKDLCEEGILEKTGKGRYRLAEPEESPAPCSCPASTARI